MVRSDRTAVIDLSATAPSFKCERAGGASISRPVRLGRLLQALLRYPAQPVNKLGQVLHQPREMRFPLVVPFVHVERTVDFDLQRVTVHARTPVMTGREPAGIGRVDRNGEAVFDKEAAGGFDELWGAGCPVAVAQDDVGPALLARGVGSRRHRMAIDEQTAAEQRCGLFDETAQRPMIGAVQPFNPPLRLREAKLLRVNLLAASDYTSDRAKTHADPWRSCVDEFRQGVGEHARIELVGLAVYVNVSTREAGRQQGSAEARRRPEELVDKAVLGPPQSHRVEPRGGEEIGRIFGPAMRRGEDERQAARNRLLQIENSGSR